MIEEKNRVCQNCRWSYDDGVIMCNVDLPANLLAALGLEPHQVDAASPKYEFYSCVLWKEREPN